MSIPPPHPHANNAFTYQSGLITVKITNWDTYWKQALCQVSWRTLVWNESWIFPPQPAQWQTSVPVRNDRQHRFKIPARIGQTGPTERSAGRQSTNNWFDVSAKLPKKYNVNVQHGVDGWTYTISSVFGFNLNYSLPFGSSIYSLAVSSILRPVHKLFMPEQEGCGEPLQTLIPHCRQATTPTAGRDRKTNKHTNPRDSLLKRRYHNFRGQSRFLVSSRITDVMQLDIPVRRAEGLHCSTWKQEKTEGWSQTGEERQWRHLLAEWPHCALLLLLLLLFFFLPLFIVLNPSFPQLKPVHHHHHPPWQCEQL